MSRSLDLAALPEDIARRAQARIAAGHFANVEEVIRAGVDALDERDDDAREWLEYARLRFRQGLEAEARGEAFHLAPRDLMARIRERVEGALRA